MKIAYLTNSIIPSKFANSVHSMKMCYYLSLKYNFKVSLFGINNKQNKSIKEIHDIYGTKQTFKIKLFKKYTNKFGIILFHIKVFLNLFNYQIIYSRHPFFLFSLLLLKKKYILEIHDLRIFNSFFYLKIFKYFLYNNRLISIILVSNQLSIDFLKILPDLRNKILVAHDGSSNFNKFEINEKIPFNNTFTFNVIYVGSLHPGKGMEIIKPLSSHFKEFGFHIIGGNDDEVRKYKNEFKNQNNIFLYGHISHNEIKNYIYKSDVCLLPNLPEMKIFIKKKYIEIGKYTSPLKMFEYMSVCKPIIASNLNNLKEVLIHKHNALLCSHDDLNQWIKAINSLHKDSKLRLLLAKNAKKDLKDKYLWEVRIKKIFTFSKLI